MKKILLLFFLLITFTLASCNKENLEEEVAINSTVEQELAELKAQNELLKNELENINNLKKEEIKELEKKEPYIPTQEEIKLAWCEITKKVWDLEWCTKNTELIKDVEWYENKFSRSAQNDSWFKWVYESENQDKLYTFEYLEKACWVIENEWLIIDSNVKESCPCPNWYHIPTPKEWKDSYLFYKENINLFTTELLFNKNTSTRDKYGSYGWNLSMNIYHTSFLWTWWPTRVSLWEKRWKFEVRDWWRLEALSLRCIKNK